MIEALKKPLNVTPESEKKVKRCLRCGDVIPKKGNRSWKQYLNRKYCGSCWAIRSEPLEEEVGDLPLGSYIGTSTQNGKLMANFYIGILEAADEVDNNKPIDDATSVTDIKNRIIATYKGIPISTEMVKTAAEWLTVNWIGKPGQRTPPADIDNRNVGEKLVEMEFILRELGYKMVKA